MSVERMELDYYRLAALRKESAAWRLLTAGNVTLERRRAQFGGGQYGMPGWRARQQ
jgi:hypothetical protein